jgi:hypothetical protein
MYWTYTFIRKQEVHRINYLEIVRRKLDPLCGLVVRVLGHRFGGLGSIPGTTKKNK